MTPDETARGTAGAVDARDTRAPSLTEAETLIATQRREYARRATVGTAPILLAWGLAWLLGYLALALAETGGALPGLPAYLLFAVCMLSAGAFTVVYIIYRARGVRGTSGRQGSLYGAGWAGGMLLVGVILARLNSFMEAVGTSEARAVGSLVSSAVPCLVVGVMLLVGAAVWEETFMGALGGWILAVTAAATVVGLPWAWWIMAVAGGGGILLGTAVHALGSRRVERL